MDIHELHTYQDELESSKYKNTVIADDVHTFCHTIEKIIDIKMHIIPRQYIATTKYREILNKLCNICQHGNYFLVSYSSVVANDFIREVYVGKSLSSGKEGKYGVFGRLNDHHNKDVKSIKPKHFDYAIVFNSDDKRYSDSIISYIESVFIQILKKRNDIILSNVKDEHATLTNELELKFANDIIRQMYYLDKLHSPLSVLTKPTTYVNYSELLKSNDSINIVDDTTEEDSYIEENDTTFTDNNVIVDNTTKLSKTDIIVDKAFNKLSDDLSKYYSSNIILYVQEHIKKYYINKFIYYIQSDTEYINATYDGIQIIEKCSILLDDDNNVITSSMISNILTDIYKELKNGL